MNRFWTSKGFLAFLLVCAVCLLAAIFQATPTTVIRVQTVAMKEQKVGPEEPWVPPQDPSVPLKESGASQKKINPLTSLGVYNTHSEAGWSALNCDTSVKLRQVSIPVKFGNFTFYIYDSEDLDKGPTFHALRGNIYEKEEIWRFHDLTAHLPLIDIGANVGLVALQAALQGRQVLAVEPIPDNAFRLARSSQDFYQSRVTVIQNAVSSKEGPVTLDTPKAHVATWFRMSNDGKPATSEAVKTSSITMDRLLDVLRFPKAALKIDVEGHEGHVIAGAEKLFQQVDIPFVWMEWEHVKKASEFGGQSVKDFMARHGYRAVNLQTGATLPHDNHMSWPFSILWQKG